VIEKLYPKLLVVLQFGLIGLMIFFSHGILNSVLGFTIFILGLAIGLWAINHNKRGNFNIQPNLKDGCKLITTGAYRYIRHPMYTSVITMMFAVLLATPILLEFILFVVLILILVLKAKREENLWCGHDATYTEYKNKTKLFIPYIL
jgi:protein-S-isoprenylcysteine O-methyltransferase Ste14